MAKKENDLDMKSAVVGMVSVFVIIALLAVWITLDAFFFTNMWRWWVSSQFDLPELTYYQAIGISLIIYYFRNQHFYDFKVKFLKGIFTDFLIFGLSWFVFLLSQ